VREGRLLVETAIVHDFDAPITLFAETWNASPPGAVSTLHANALLETTGFAEFNDHRDPCGGWKGRGLGIWGTWDCRLSGLVDVDVLASKRIGCLVWRPGVPLEARRSNLHHPSSGRPLPIHTCCSPAAHSDGKDSRPPGSLVQEAHTVNTTTRNTRSQCAACTSSVVRILFFLFFFFFFFFNEYL